MSEVPGEVLKIPDKFEPRALPNFCVRKAHHPGLYMGVTDLNKPREFRYDNIYYYN